MALLGAARPSWILPKFTFIGKMRKMQICFARVVKYDTIKDFAAFDNL